MGGIKGFFTKIYTNIRNALDEWQQSLQSEEEGEDETSLPQKNLVKKNQRKGSMSSGYMESLNDGKITLEDLEDMSKPLEGEDLRLQQQIIESCKRVKMRDGEGVEYRLEKPFKRVVRVSLRGKYVYIDRKGIFDDEENPIYIPFKMERSEGLTRMVRENGDKYIKLFIDLITIFEISVYAISSESEEKVTNNNEGTDKPPPF